MNDDKRKKALLNNMGKEEKKEDKPYPVIKSKDELDKLPPGSFYRTEEGGAIHLKPSEV